MPLVSGVCRAASAPMLSHGGSRLNASKPEANPKTSCPNPDSIYIKLSNLYIMNSLKKTIFCWRKERASEKEDNSGHASFCHFLWAKKKKETQVFFFLFRDCNHMFQKTPKTLQFNRIASQNRRTFRFSRRHEVHQKFTRILLFFYLAVIFFGKKKRLVQLYHFVSVDIRGGNISIIIY